MCGSKNLVSNINPFQALSKYRTELMGFAIVWIIIFHTPISNHLHPFIIKFIPFVGYGGVDIFIFLSGYGLYFSSQKKMSLGRFYLRRMIRVIPAFILMPFLINLIQIGALDGFTPYLTKLTTFSYFRSNLYAFWYVPCILVFYLLYPFYFKIFKRYPTLVTALGILVGIGSTIYYGETHLFDFVILFLARIPIFCIGIYIAKLSTENKLSRMFDVKVLYMLMLIGTIILYIACATSSPYLWGGLLWLPFAFIVPGLLLLLAKLFDVGFFKKYFNKAFCFLGSISLELYLTHVALFNLAPNYAVNFDIPYILFIILLIPISIVLAYFFSKITHNIAKLVG